MLPALLPRGPGDGALFNQEADVGVTCILGGRCQLIVSTRGLRAVILTSMAPIRAQWRYWPPVSAGAVSRHPLRTRDSAEHGQRHPALRQRRLHAAPDRTARFHTRRCPPAPRRSRLPRIRLGPDLAGAERLSARSARLAALRVRDRLSAPLHGGEFPAGRCAAVRSGDPALAAGHHRHAGTGRASAPADAARQSQPEPV